MNRTEYLLTQAASEAVEFAHRVTKALHFGLQEVEPGQPHTNAARAVGEFIDLVAVMDMLSTAGVIAKPEPSEANAAIAAKQAKVEKYLAYAMNECGTVTSES